ncbi:MAG: hypothetical protein ACR5KV_08210 [Wolbachia sp.]
MSTVIAIAIVEVAALSIGYAKYEMSRINDEMKELQNVDVHYVSMTNMLLPT